MATGVVASVVDEVVSLAAADPETFRVHDVEASMRALSQLRCWLDAFEARVVARSDELAASGVGGGGRESLLLDGAMSGRRAGRVAARAETLRANPALAGALHGGEIGSEHVDAVTRAVAEVEDDENRAALLADPEVVDAACRMPADPFATWVRTKARALNSADEVTKLAKQKAATGLRYWKRSDGMHVLAGQFDPETGSALFRAIDAEIDTLAQTQRAPHDDHTAAHALASLAERGLGAGPNTTPPEIAVIDAATLVDGVHDHTVCETQSGAQLPPDTIGRICCEAIMLPTIINRENGQVLHAGRHIRVANRAQRRALRAMYPTCAFGACATGFDHCQIHHIVPWEQGGPTDLDNLLPLCSRHHHLVHEGQWRIHLEAGRTLVIHRPDGRHHKTVPLPTRELAHHLTRNREPDRKPNNNKNN